jgi:hypothetical protein
MEKVYDFISWAGFKYRNWRYENRDRNIMTLLLWLILPLIIYLVWRLMYKKKVTKIKRDKPRERVLKKPDRKSVYSYKKHYPDYYASFSEIEARLRRYGLSRYPWESLQEFIARVEQSDLAESPLKPGLLRELSRLHNKLRFNPDNFHDDEKEELMGIAREWLKK